MSKIRSTFSGVFNAVFHPMIFTAALLVKRKLLLPLPTVTSLEHAALTMIGAAIFTSLVMALFGGLKDIESQDKQNRQKLSAPMKLKTALFAGAAEEMFFRGTIQRALTPIIGVWMSVLASAFVFGFAHNAWDRKQRKYALTAGCLGLGMGVGYALTGDIWVPIIAHTLQNSLVMAHDVTVDYLVPIFRRISAKFS